MTARRAFDLAAFRKGWRDLAADHGLDPITGEPLAATDAGWWKDPEMWSDPGPAHSVVEAQAIASIAAQARAAAPPKLTTLEAIGLIREVVAEMASERLVQQMLPLRELHARRGVEVAEVLGIRMEVPIRVA